MPGGDVIGETELVQASALVGQPALYSKRPSQRTCSWSIWHDLRDPGVKRVLVVGIGLLIISAVLWDHQEFFITHLNSWSRRVLGFYDRTMGISSSSASLLISALTTFVMLPAVAIAMKFMESVWSKDLTSDYNTNLDSISTGLSNLESWG